jgi:flagellin-like protein
VRRTLTDRARWWGLFGALVVVTWSWALLSPIMSGHDEPSHAVRAAAVVRGQLLGDPDPDAFPSEPNVLITVRVPEAYLYAGRAGCFHRQPQLTPHCAPELTGTHEQVDVHTYQFRSQPAYYALVGLPSLVDPGEAGMYGMRLLSGAVCAALLASALASARAAVRPAWVVLGVAVAVVPEALYLASTISSNAVEVAAAISLWTALAAMAAARGAPAARSVARAGVALTVLVATRGLSPAFAVLVLVAMAIVAGREQVRGWWAVAGTRRWLAASGVVAVASLAYIEGVRRWLPIEREGQGLATALDRLPWYLRQGVGIFGSNDIPLPDLVYGVWAVAVVSILLLALWVAPPRAGLVLVGVALAGIGLQIGAEGFALPPIGFFWQGRYALPVLVGVPILAGHLLSEHGSRLARLERGAPLAVAALGVTHVVALLEPVRRYAVTVEGPRNPITFLTDPVWSPDTGPAWVWVALFTAGLAAAGWLALRPAPVDVGG